MEAQDKTEVLEMLEVMAQVKAECLPPPSGPPFAHEDAVSSLAGLALPNTPGLGSLVGTPAGTAAAATLPATPKQGHGGKPCTSGFLGVTWYKSSRQWKAEIRHNGERHRLGPFDDEQEAARAYDTAARRLRPKGEAHGGRAGNTWKQLNFPTAEEAAFAEDAGMEPPKKKRKV